jgi:putative transposase
MPNHIHLAAEPEDPANLPKLMLALNRTYTKYFNQKYEKVGHLWQGRYKSRIIAKDDYLFGCLSYIEANPVRAGLATDPREYRWSSYKSRNLGEDHPILDEMTF